MLDEVALPAGQLRARPSGSAGGHNGLKSVEAALGTAAYPRLRIGVGGGRPDPDYVLGRFAKEERKTVEEIVDRACEAVRCWMDDGIEKCMTRYNRRGAGEGLA